MRNYTFTLTNATTGQVYVPSNNGFAMANGGTTFSTLIQNPHGSGQSNNPAAVCLELDLPVTAYHEPQGRGWLRFWGVGLGMIAQSVGDFNPQFGKARALFTLYGGMSPGLPLATAAYNDNQAGVLAQGEVFQAFGNWSGVNQTLEFVVQPVNLVPSSGRINFNWMPNTPLSAALATTFYQAFPDYKNPLIQISPLLFLPANSTAQAGSYPDLTSFAGVINDFSRALGTENFGLGEHYPGVSIAIDQGNKKITAYDGTVPIGKLTTLKFQDLIGQPTWVDPGTVNFRTVLRADIVLGSQIKFPQGIQAPYVLTTQGAAQPNSPAMDKVTFQGTFNVTEVHHFGNSRAPDGDSWVTAFSAVSLPPPAPLFGIKKAMTL